MEDDSQDSPVSPIAWKKIPARSLPKHKFSQKDDEKLKEIVQRVGEDDWDEVARQMGPRNARQCKDRWDNYLSPKINKEPWTEEEDELLIKKQLEIGSKWVQIAKFFKGRTDASVKNRWQMLDRKEKKQNNILAKKKPVKKENTIDAKSLFVKFEFDDRDDIFKKEDFRFLDFTQFSDSAKFLQDFLF